MTITQGCRPLALAFGERSTWLAPGSRGQGGDVHRAEGTRADPAAASPAGGGGSEGLREAWAGRPHSWRLEADSIPKRPTAEP